MPYYMGPQRGGFLSGLTGLVLKPLAKAGVIRGTVGKALGYKPPSSSPLGMSIPKISINPPFFGAPGAGVAIGGGVAQHGGCPPGFHPDKATGSKCVRNRRMNPTNPRAARRAISRLTGFERIARRIVTFKTGRSPGKGRVKSRARR